MYEEFILLHFRTPGGKIKIVMSFVGLQIHF